MEATIDEKAATKLAILYVGSFPNQPHDPDILLEQITQWCLGKPVNVLEHMCNPSHGAVTKSDKPCLKSLNRWYEDWVGKDAPLAIPHFEPIEDPAQEPDEVRRAAVKRWERVRESVVKTNCVGRPMKPIQKPHAIDELLSTDRMRGLY